jgi:hypothetical protein
MLVYGGDVYINGERHGAGGVALRQLAALADLRSLPPAELAPRAADLLYEWYSAGYIQLGAKRAPGGRASGTRSKSP